MRLRKVSHLSSHLIRRQFRSHIHVVFSDYSKGFGGKYGVEREKVDRAALGYDYKSQTEKHQSQKGEFMLSQLTILSQVV